LNEPMLVASSAASVTPHAHSTHSTNRSSEKGHRGAQVGVEGGEAVPSTADPSPPVSFDTSARASATSCLSPSSIDASARASCVSPSSSDLR
jgi:hypothetical protein